MSIAKVIIQKSIAKHSLPFASGVPHAAMNDICSVKARIARLTKAGE